MRKLLVLSLVASFVVLAASPAEAVRRSKPGADFAYEGGGACQVTTPGEDAFVSCDLSESKRLYYKFRLPRHAHRIDVKVDRDCLGCCGSFRVEHRREGSQRRRLLTWLRVNNYGNIFGPFECTIHRVEVRYWRT